MKKIVLAVVACVAMALGATGVASAINGAQEIDVKVAANKAGTTAKPRSIKTLTIDITTTPAPDDPPFATKQTIVYFDKNLVFNSKKFPNCPAARIQQNKANCPAGSKVGSGTAQGNALGQIENLTVEIFNGPNNRVNLLVRGSAPLVINSVIEGRLTTASGKFARKLVVDIPANLQQPLTGVYATLTKFVTKVSATRNGVPYIALKGCTGGKLQFRGTFSYTDGTSKTADDTANCRR